MTTTARHPLVEGYLKRLRADAAALPVDQAHELLADIEEHLRAALPHDATETQVRNVLERLGAPEDLVAAASGDPETPAPGPRSFASPSGAIACLVIAEVLFILFPIAIAVWIIGLVMLGRATVWTEREKGWGFLALGTGFPAITMAALAGTMVTTTCESWASSDGSSGTTCGGTNWVAIVAWTLTLGYLALQAFTAWRLLRSARRP
jgi:uncharacterized membrane protein